VLDTLSLSEDLSGPTRALKIRETIKKSHGFEPQVLLLTPEEIESAIESNPFPEAESEPKTLYVQFLASMPKNPDPGALESIKGDHERFALKDGAFYLHAPDDIGRSKLAANAETFLGVAVTSRNWRTARTAFYDPYRTLGSDCWKWKKSSASYLPLTRTKRSKLAP
jgi:uncharacterized protein (DUF1697 family)